MQEGQSNTFTTKKLINCGGQLLDLSTPVVMGIINVTPDSFFDCGNQSEIDGALAKAEKHLTEGAAIIDIGAVSTRPGAKDVSPEIERQRLLPTIEAIKKHFPEAILSADTFRSEIARVAVESGADIINDISGGTMDEHMFQTIAKLQVPYILMHIQGTPQTMQAEPYYDDVVKEVLEFFIERVTQLRSMGVHDIILDPGFGFGKTVEHNFSLLRSMKNFGILGLPLLAGLSRKSMINRVLGTKPESALNGTTALNMIALQYGASILRVHDVKEAVECVKLHLQLR